VLLINEGDIFFVFSHFYMFLYISYTVWRS